MDNDARFRWDSPLDLPWYDMLSWDTISETSCAGWCAPESVIPPDVCLQAQSLYIYT